MLGKFISTKTKTKVLVQYVKDYEVRDVQTLGIVFRLWSELEALDRGLFLNDLAYITDEPLLIINSDSTPASLTYKGKQYEEINDIFSIIHSCDRYYLYLVFPEPAAPFWYLNICVPNPFVKALPGIQQFIEEISRQMVFNEEFVKVYREALMVLINGALKAGDKEQFIALSEEWKKIA